MYAVKHPNEDELETYNSCHLFLVNVNIDPTL